MMGFEGEGKISIWKLGSQIMKVFEYSDNQSGCYRAMFDRDSTRNNLNLISAHENKKIEIVKLRLADS